MAAKCSLLILLFGSLKLVLRFAWVRLRVGFKGQWVGRKWRFSAFSELNSSLLKLQVETSSPTFRVRLKIIISFFTNPEIDDSLNGHLTGLQQNA